MKRIETITITNFCVYEQEMFELQNGSNLLIYGENGSGKSSLYKAIQRFFKSSLNSTVAFTKNKYFEANDGSISVVFSDFTLSDAQRIPVKIDDTVEEYVFSSTPSLTTNGVPLIRTASRVSGFLDYTDLLKVYLHENSNPNLFDHIVVNLLGEHIPFSSGGTVQLGQKWRQLNMDLFNAYSKNVRCHKIAFNELPIFELHLRALLDAVFSELNRLLDNYFEDLHINLQYNLKPIVFNHGRSKSNWNLEHDLRLQVVKDGGLVLNDYNSVLNEARLSAIAVCLYLASLLKMPTAVDCKILFLDDVFIGLDSGNRLPILQILKNEFKFYQKIIASYDRQWYELTKNYVEIYDKGCWQMIEMYSSFDDSQNRPRSIIVKGDSSMDRACRYLHNKISPDYPAAANYMRKAIEKLLSTGIPKHEKIDGNLMQIESYKLSALIHKFHRFLERVGEDTTDIEIIISLLRALLHPLSHYEIDSPMYRKELVLIEKAYRNVEKMIAVKNFKTSSKCILDAGSRIRLNIKNSVIDYYYDIALIENIISYNSTVVEAKCRLKRMYGTLDGSAQGEYTPNKNNKNYHYDSLKDMVSKISSYIVTQGQKLDSLPADYISMFEYHDGINWMNLRDKLS